MKILQNTKNTIFSLFFKVNFLLSFTVLLAFMTYNDEYSVITFVLVLMGSFSTVILLYALVYILMLLFSRTTRFILYASGIVFVGINLIFITDFFIYRLYKFHINAMVIDIITSPEALDSMQLGIWPILLFAALSFSLITIEFILIHKLVKMNSNYANDLNTALNKRLIYPILTIVMIEKISYGAASLQNHRDILSHFEVIPYYQPLTFNRIAAKYFGYQPKIELENTIQIQSKIHYPLAPLNSIQHGEPFHIFIIVSDAAGDSYINEKTTPNLTHFKEDAIVFNHHYSGGNATRFGIFSLLYGLNSTYWFSFLNAQKGSVLFDTLKSLDYNITIVSSTNTDWPEFRKTCFSNVQESIKDNFKGSPWEKDEQSKNYFIQHIDAHKDKQSLFSFVFFDAPHGYSYPPNHNKFNASGENINYLAATKGSGEITESRARYQNAVSYNDLLFGEMIAKLKEKKLYDNSLIIFTSDHGQEFYEYGSFGHNSSFSNAQTHSPLIIKLPKNMNSITTQKQIDHLTSHNDIVPTLMTLLGVRNDPADYSNGQNLFDTHYKRKYIFCSNWGNNAIITQNHTYIFSNLPNKMFSNEIRDNSSYKKLSKIKVDSKIVLEVMNQNRRFLSGKK